MDMALFLISNIFPLYILIGLGYVAGRWMDVNLHSMAIIAIYFLAPFVNLGAMMQLKFDTALLALPIIMFCMSAGNGFFFYKLAPRFWKDTTGNLIALGSVSGNTGYFGLPIILALFDVKYVAIYMIMNLGIAVSEVTLGYYYGARGAASMRQSLMKVVKLPVIHAIWIGLLFNTLNIPPSELFLRYWHYATGAWILIGMMLIGVALGKHSALSIEPRLAKWLFASKFIAWPLMGASVIAADILLLHLFDPQVHKMIAIICSVPLAGNLVAYAANLNLHAERAAGVVLASTFFALLSVPLAVYLVERFAGG